jgi:predicted nucleic acid-binding protein
MVLVDTSVWIRFIAGRAPFADRLDALLAKDEVVGHPFILGELLVGDRGGRTRLLHDYARMTQAGIVPNEDVVAFVRERKLGGSGVGWIDVHLLAAAMLEGLRLWTADSNLAAVSEEFGLTLG